MSTEVKPSHTAYIVPALTNQAGQCRIVARAGVPASAREDYRAHPDTWQEVGLMNSPGVNSYAWMIMARCALNSPNSVSP